MSNRYLRIGFIGGGNMAYAIVSGLIKADHDPGCLHIADPIQEQRDRIKALNQELQVTSTNPDAAEDAEMLVLAVKPQVMESAVASLAGINRPSGQMIISIAAGITVSALKKWFDPTGAVVRIMPNQPAQVAAGMSVLTASPETTDQQRDQALYVAQSIGKAEWVEEENLLDAVTAISGSGPAYFYLLMEIMEACAIDMGLPEQLARVLARQTALGSSQVADASDLSLKQLREEVTSPGGTTAAALAVLEQAGFRDIVSKALKTARNRSVELGTADKSHPNGNH